MPKKRLTSDSSLLDRLTDSGRSKPLAPVRSKNEDRIRIEGEFLGIKCLFTFPSKDIDRVLGRINERINNLHRTPGDELLFQLLDAVSSVNEQKPRGIQVHLQHTTTIAKTASPWVYLFILEVYQKVPYAPNFQRIIQAEKELATKLAAWDTKWEDMPQKRQAIYLTAALVSRACRDWSKLDLNEPLSDQHFNPDYFYRTYIKPKLEATRITIKQNRKRLLIPRINSYLRNTILTSSLDKAV